MQRFLHDVGGLTSLVTYKAQRGFVGMSGWLFQSLQR